MPNVTGYRDLLRSELVERIKKNPSYSLRAMAKQVGVAPSLLSNVISGKKNLSPERALTVAKALNFSTKNRGHFISLVQLESTKSEELKIELLEKLNSAGIGNPSFAIDLDQFKSIADWYHLAILELSHVYGMQMKPLAISQALGISRWQAEEAIQRLIRLDLLELNKRTGKLEKTLERVVASSSVQHAALRKYHEQMLAKAAASLTQQTPDERWIGSETFAFDPKDLGQAAEILEECFAKLIALSAGAKKKTQVYHAGVQLFRITRERKKS